MSVANGFPKISGIFFSIFDPEQGSKPLCQVPDGAVKPTATSEVLQTFISFDAVKNYIIPKPALCNRLVSVLYKGYRVMGYPVNIVGEHYERNSFTFNLCFIFPAGADTSPYESVISRTAKMLKALEEQSRYVSDKSNLTAFDSAMEQMFQDLNSFSECQIPIDASNKLDIKLFPILEAPLAIKGYDVPAATVKLGSLVEETWDPTLEMLFPHINGINSVRRIADLASADYNLTVRAIQHLVHYGCVVILGIYQFSNVYAPTSAVTDICNSHIFHEFSYYVYKSTSCGSAGNSLVGGSAGSTTTSDGLAPTSNARSFSQYLTVKQVCKLYTAFNTGVPLSAWCNNHRDLLQDIDLNRFIAFGLLKRLIYQVHAYPLWVSHRYMSSHSKVASCMETNGLDPAMADVVLKSIDTPTNFDALCTELRSNRATVAKVLKSLGDWAVVNI